MGPIPIPSAAAADVQPPQVRKNSVTFAGVPPMTAEEEAAAVPPPVPPELSKEELAAMTKEQRKAYHEMRRKVLSAGPEPKAKPTQLSKAERRMIQEAQRKAKENKKEAGAENEELLKELKLQGLSEDQAREVILEMAKGEGAFDQDDDEDDGEVEDLLASVRKWMAEQEGTEVSRETLRDFNMSVRFQGHVESTPPDHLACIIRVLVEQACAGVDLGAPKLHHKSIADKVEPHAKRWAPLLTALYEKIDDDLEAARTAIASIMEGINALGGTDMTGAGAVVLVGSLMAIREADLIKDEDLLASCRPIEPRSLVLDKFVEFLEEALEDEDDD